MAGNSLIDLVDELNRIKLSYDVLGAFLASVDVSYDSHDLSTLIGVVNDRLYGAVVDLSSIIKSDKIS